MDNNEDRAGGVEEHPKSSQITSPQSTIPILPSLNLMEQLLLAKMERNSTADYMDHSAEHNLGTKKNQLLRTDSVDSQISTSTFNSANSGDSTGNNYCKCDDCLLGIVDKHQLGTPKVGRQKVKR